MKPIIWLTGLPASGKTTLGKALVKALIERGHRAELIDGDEIRNTAGYEAGFTDESRTSHLWRMAFLADMLSRNDVYAVVAAIAPLADVRDAIRSKYRQVSEVYLSCPAEILQARDPKGLYKKALDGEIQNFTGISAPYDVPEAPALELDTRAMSPAGCVSELLRYLKIGVPASLFIGRWQPLHSGHVALIETVLNEGKRVVIGIRDTPLSSQNPYTVAERADMIRAKFGDRVEIMTVPDIDEIVYGRGVGYSFREIRLAEDVEAISGTAIRKVTLG